MPAGTAMLLSSLAQFQDRRITLDRLRKQGLEPGLDVFEQCAAAGLIASAREILEECKIQAGAVKSGNLVSLCWLACNRPDSLAASIRSALNDGPTKVRELQFHVFDDSVADREGIARAITAIEKEYSCTIALHDDAAKRQYLKRLNLSSEASKLAHFALFPNAQPSTGGNRNAVLLMTAGQKILCLDDDIRLTCYRPHLEPPRFSSAYLTGDWYMFPSIIEITDFLDSNCKPAHAEFVDFHSEALQNTPAEIALGENSWRSLTPELANKLLTHSLQIRVTSSGSYGDSGLASPAHALFLDGEMRQHLLRDADTYRRSIASRQLLRMNKGLTIKRSTQLMGMSLGLDNSALLPPFFPAFRNSDGLFASCLVLCFPEACLADLPIMPGHIPPGFRQHDHKDLFEIPWRVPEILHSLIHACPEPLASSGIENMRELARFIQYNTVNEEVFQSCIIEQRRKALLQQLQQLDGLLEKFYAEPNFWAEDVEKRCDRIFDLLKKESWPINAGDGSEVVPYVTARELLRKYAMLLEIWPEIYARATELNSN